MALTFLSGTDEYIGRRKKSGKKKHRVAKIAMAPARAAFLEATRLNILQLGNKLAKLYKKNPSEVANFWDKFGGDVEKLKRAISQGSKQKLSGDQVGAVALAAGVASALPIVLKAIDMFKKFGLHDSDDEKQAQNFTDVAQGQLEKDPEVTKTKATLPPGEKAGKIVSDDESGTHESGTDANGNPVPFYKNKKVLIGTGIGLLVIGGAIAYSRSHRNN